MISRTHCDELKPNIMYTQARTYVYMQLKILGLSNVTFFVANEHCKKDVAISSSSSLPLTHCNFLIYELELKWAQIYFPAGWLAGWCRPESIKYICSVCMNIVALQWRLRHL